jgi:hypothetical protein
MLLIFNNMSLLHPQTRIHQSISPQPGSTSTAAAASPPSSPGLVVVAFVGFFVGYAHYQVLRTTTTKTKSSRAPPPLPPQPPPMSGLYTPPHPRASINPIPRIQGPRAHALICLPSAPFRTRPLPAAVAGAGRATRGGAPAAHGAGGGVPHAGSRLAPRRCAPVRSIDQQPVCVPGLRLPMHNSTHRCTHIQTTVKAGRTAWCTRAGW